MERILVIDDESELQEILIEGLKLEGYECVGVDDADQPSVGGQNRRDGIRVNDTVLVTRDNTDAVPESFQVAT